MAKKITEKQAREFITRVHNMVVLYGEPIPQPQWQKVIINQYKQKARHELLTWWTAQSNTKGTTSGKRKTIDIVDLQELIRRLNELN